MKERMKKFRKNHKGFSLVELIIVIAIMAILVGILAPQFIKYVERSRRSTDVKNAQEIASAIEADIADGAIDFSTATTDATFTGSVASGITTAPTLKATVNGGGTAGGSFTYSITTGGAVTVKAGSKTLYPTVDAAYE